MTDLGPFDLTGPAFLKLYLVLLVTATLLAMLLPRLLRPEGREHQVTDQDQLAYLAGGRLRLVDALLSRLIASGAMVIDRTAKLMPQFVTNSANAAEVRSVFGYGSGPTSWADLVRRVRGYADRVEEQLVRTDQMMTNGAAWQLRLMQTVPLALLILFGSIKYQVGVARDKPVGYLTGLLIVTAVITVFRLAAIDRRTRAGIAAVRHARQRLERLRRAPTTQEAGLAVALFGTAVLAGSALDDYHQLRAATSGGGDGGTSADGGGGGSSGCGGGGCGGCGG